MSKVGDEILEHKGQRAVFGEIQTSSKYRTQEENERA